MRSLVRDRAPVAYRFDDHEAPVLLASLRSLDRHAADPESRRAVVTLEDGGGRVRAWDRDGAWWIGERLARTLDPELTEVRNAIFERLGE